jgi:xylulokinase
MLKAEFGPERFYAINANILGASYTLPKVLWLKKNDPRLYDRTDLFLPFDGLVGFLLGGEPVISRSQASRTLMYDLHQKDWSEEIIGAMGIDRNKLPRCLPGGARAGTVSGTISHELGLPRNIPIIVGGHDQCCNALGAGVTEPGQAVYGIGSFECITPVYDHIPETRTMLSLGLNIEDHVVKDRYVSFLFNQGGSLVRWFRDTFARESSAQKGIYDRLAAEMPEEPTGLFVLPYFQPTGSPGYISDASGVIAGLKMNTSRGAILKAIMESVTYYFAEGITSLGRMGINTSRFIATGGGAASDPWLQIKADILGVPFMRPGTTECGLIGTAILAGTACGVFGTPGEGAASMVKPGRIFEPDSGRHETYRGRLEKYRTLYPTMKGFLSEKRFSPFPAQS